MRIKKILYQNRRDFHALFECEHCGKVVEKRGYDDAYFHNKVVPNMPCEFCGKNADESYRPLQTKYPEGYQV